MAIKGLITTDEIRERMSLQDMDDINIALESAIVSAQVYFQEALDTEFVERVGVEDLFYLDLNRYGFLSPPGQFKLRLSHGFLSSITSVTVSSELEFTTSEAVTPPKTDLVKGVVFIPEEWDQYYVKVVYNSGFTATNKAPDWLKEAVLSYIPSVLNSQPITNRNEEAAPVSKLNADFATRLVEAHLRVVPFDVRPIA